VQLGVGGDAEAETAEEAFAVSDRSTHRACGKEILDSGHEGVVFCPRPNVCSMV